jgi:hypothetical protein
MDRLCIGVVALDLCARLGLLRPGIGAHMRFSAFELADKCARLLS